MAAILLGLFLGFLTSHAEEASAPQSNNETNIVVTPSPTTTIETKKTIKSVANDIPVDVRSYSKEEVIALITQYSTLYGISADLPLRVAYCESGYNWNSKNSHSTASGVFQYLASTWRNTEAGRAGISVFDAEANVKMGVYSIAHGGISNWDASRSCWNHE